jgi:hypothetical protein
MHIAMDVLQIIVALILLNVWLLRLTRRTAYRGGNANSMKEEFAVYGLPSWSMYLVGLLKVGASVCLLAGVWLHFLVFPAALLIFLLMLGALAMHLKVRDPLLKSAPAIILLVLTGCICLALRR